MPNARTGNVPNALTLTGTAKNLNPAQHLSLIWFVIWSSLVHGLIMLVQALRDPVETPNLYGDIPALLLVAVVLWVLMPKKVG